MCLFDAQSADDVRKVNDAAKLPFTRIVEALDLTPASIAMRPLGRRAAIERFTVPPARSQARAGQHLTRDSGRTKFENRP